MLVGQIILWTLLSLVTGMVTYYVLTEGKSNYLLIMSFFFSLVFGVSTAYLWLQITSGLSAFGWEIAILPIIFTFGAELVFLSFYAMYHRKQSFPRIPKFTYSRASTIASVMIIIVMAFMLASMQTIPSEETTPSMTTLGSTQTTTVETSDITSTEISDLPSTAILIQSGVVSPTDIRDNPRLNEYLNFKVQFSPVISYTQSYLKVFVQDSNGELIDQDNIKKYDPVGDTVEGQIYCDEQGTYTITVLAYDLSISETMPLASATQSYVVQGLISEQEPLNMVFLLFSFIIICIVVLLVMVSFWKKYN